MSMSESYRLSMLAPRSGKRRIVIDTDTYNEIDDQFAIVHALLSPESVDVEAIYAAPFVNETNDDPGGGMELSYEEILALLQRLSIPHEGLVYRGVTNYVGPGKQPVSAPAVDDLIARARNSSSGDPLYVIAMAAISNVASAILAAPDIIDRIVVVWLGGHAIDWQHQNEFNLEQDIGGTQVLFDSGVPLVLVPCEGVTSILHSTVPEIERYVEPSGEIGRFLAMRFKGYCDDHVGWAKEIWDMGATAWVLNADWAPSVLMPTPILTDDMHYSLDRSRHMMRYVYAINRNGIMKDFIVRLSAVNAAAGEQMVSPAA
ncbi:nucleoside hydrolase [Rhizobium sp. KVB221]|uniref:Nucleoside hydrolase n=1 Tax=Rhizobium setariae TaxID=2801340 RepID=A0A936YRJ4_9HYPH|nr:nucleoside hydrolase [Rhizobium setariae]MBL0373442.1 nucleoside hydrolase [Rhizobium setariae]